MNTLSRARTGRYESMDLGDDPAKREPDRGWRAFSRRKKESRNLMLFYDPSGHRRERAKQRQIFLKTYTLSSMEGSDSEVKSKPKNLRKAVAVKVKKAVVSVVSFMRISSVSLWSCKSGSGVRPSRATPFGSCFKC